jgi:hypothetical protein
MVVHLHVLLLCVETDVVEADGEENLSSHDVLAGVAGQLEVEEAGVSLGQALVLVGTLGVLLLLVCAEDRLDQETKLSALKLLVVWWNR